MPYTSNICGMKKILSVLLISLVTAFTGACDSYAYIDRSNAVINILDKASGKNHMFTIPVDEVVNYEKLSFAVRSCKQTDPFQPENAYMFIEILQNDNQIFGGWMNKNAPGENPLQNADYDIWLVRCE